MHALCNLAKSCGPLIGRILIAFIFLQSGYDKIMNYSKTVTLMTQKGMPMAEVLIIPTIIILIGGGLMILLGWYARWGALALIVFLIPATIYFHDYWAYTSVQQLNQFHHFVKNLAILGALFYIMGLGSGPLSLKKESETR
jgi:putative oxidoreductase